MSILDSKGNNQANDRSRLKVIQWGAGYVGTQSLRYILESTELELVGVRCHSDDKVGKTAGELCGLSATGPKATQDSAALIALERSQAMFACQEHASEIHIHALLPRFQIQLGGNRVSTEQHHAGIRNDRIQTTETRLQVTHGVGDLLFASHIDFERNGSAAGLPDRRGSLFRGIAIDIQHPDLRSFFRKLDRHTATDSRSRAGHDRPLST